MLTLCVWLVSTKIWSHARAACLPIHLGSWLSGMASKDFHATCSCDLLEEDPNVLAVPTHHEFDIKHILGNVPSHDQDDGCVKGTSQVCINV